MMVKKCDGCGAILGTHDGMSVTYAGDILPRQHFCDGACAAGFFKREESA